MAGSHHVSFVSSNLWPFFCVSLFIMTLTIVKITGQVCHTLSLDSGCLILSQNRLKLWVLRKRPRGEIPGRNFFKEQVAQKLQTNPPSNQIMFCSFCLYLWEILCQFCAEVFQFRFSTSLKKIERAGDCRLPWRLEVGARKLRPAVGCVLFRRHQSCGLPSSEPQHQLPLVIMSTVLIFLR